MCGITTWTFDSPLMCFRHAQDVAVCYIGQCGPDSEGLGVSLTHNLHVPTPGPPANILYAIFKTLDPLDLP